MTQRSATNNSPTQGARRARLARLVRRSRQVFVIAALCGVLVGAAVAGFERLVHHEVLSAIDRAPIWVVVLSPTVGLLLAAGFLRWGRTTGSTTDEYIKAVHDSRPMSLRPVAARLAASASTLGSGGPLGFEGPSVYLGASLGVALQRRLKRYFGSDQAKVLLIAGAAAGVAAIFKAPATGAVFALEVPYTEDLAHRSLLPALVASATSYLTFSLLNGSGQLLPIGHAPPLDWIYLVGALIVGVTCGVGARLYATVMMAAKRASGWGNPVVRALLAGLVLAGLALITHRIYGTAFTLGSGYRSVAWALDTHRMVWLVGLLALLRVASTAAVLAGGGSGGLFVPLVVEGTLFGRFIAGLLESFRSSPQLQQTVPLFMTLGVAGFLGAGYRVPLAAVMFVAESTGQPVFIVPGLLCAVAAQLAMGSKSCSPYQRQSRTMLSSGEREDAKQAAASTNTEPKSG